VKIKNQSVHGVTKYKIKPIKTAGWSFKKKSAKIQAITGIITKLGTCSIKGGIQKLKMAERAVCANLGNMHDFIFYFTT